MMLELGTLIWIYFFRDFIVIRSCAKIIISKLAFSRRSDRGGGGAKKCEHKKQRGGRGTKIGFVRVKVIRHLRIEKNTGTSLLSQRLLGLLLGTGKKFG